jgi:hypothetical protein
MADARDAKTVRFARSCSTEVIFPGLRTVFAYGSAIILRICGEVDWNILLLENSWSTDADLGSAEVFYFFRPQNFGPVIAGKGGMEEIA